MKFLGIMLFLILYSSCSTNNIKVSDLIGRWEIKEIRNFVQFDESDFKRPNMAFIDKRNVFIPYLSGVPMNSKMYCNWKFSGKNVIYIEDCRQSLLTGEYDVYLNNDRLILRKGLASIELVRIVGNWQGGGFPANF